MLLSASARRLLLAVHIAVSVGWLGAIVAYLALDVTAATSDDVATLRAAYVGMDLVARTAILPLAATALLSGVAIAAGTRWGLLRHYWVVFSLVLTLVAVLVLLVELGTIARHAEIAAAPATSDADLRALPGTLPHSIGGLLVLLLVFALNVWKPRGMTRYGWRKERAERDANAADATVARARR